MFLRLTVLIAGVLAATSAFATNIISIDEVGNLKVDGVASQGTIARDPISNIFTLSYTLPFAGNVGDVVLTETPASGVASDILRFPGNGHAYFFSDLEAGDTIDAADQPNMPTPITPNVVLNEVGAEGNNSATYSPGAAGIGGNANSPNLTYTIISDVPEPSGILLAGLGGGLVLVVGRRREAAENRS